MTIRCGRAASVVAGAWFGLVVASIPASLRAQQTQTQLQLDPTVQAAVDAAVARAQGQGLPTEPLIDKAFEGTAKHAEPARIVTAVRRLASGLSSARRELGEATRAADLVAGAEVLRAGVEADALARLRRSRPSESLLVPLVVMADLVSRGVPPRTAADAVLGLADRGAADADFDAMQQEIQHDIQAGATPADAASIRSRGRGAGDAAPIGNGRGTAVGGGKPAATPPKPRSNGNPHPPSGAGPQQPKGKPPGGKPTHTPGGPADGTSNGPSKSRPPQGTSPH